MIHQCLDCGLAVQDGDAWHCFKYRKLVTEDPQGCPSFIERQFEDGEILTPVQHLLLLEQELKRHHMKGTISGAYNHEYI